MNPLVAPGAFDSQPDHANGLALFRSAVAAGPERPFVHYFDTTLSYGEVDALSHGLATSLAGAGFVKGDRLACFMQNIPQFLIVLFATWKRGGIFVPINPMNRARELAFVLNDAEPKVLVLENELFELAYTKLEDDVHRPATILSTSGWEFQQRPDERLFAGTKPATPDGASDLLAFAQAGMGIVTDPAIIEPDDIAMLVYTSGTSGVPKAAINLHKGVAWGAQLSRGSQDLPDGVVTLAIAPLFHIAGIVMAGGSTIHAMGSLILCYRFDPAIVIEAIARHKPQTTSGSVTVYIALMNAPGATREILGSIVKPFSGGAPVPVAVVEQYRAFTGNLLRAAYGLTETTGGAFMEPTDGSSRIDPETVTLSVGKPVATFSVRIVDDHGKELPAGEAGEIVLSGPAVSPGYWRNPVATAEAMHPDGFRTGDIGFLDEDGWLFIIDRKKDMIIAGGYKVWPREVEDVIYTHHSVKEVGVIGVADAYRGETVRAIVSLKPGMKLSEADLIDYCKQRMAAYKYPRSVKIIDDLPKSPAGKILRRNLQEY
ncbi:AMP-binding protein [Sphingobium sp. CR2-8]|uniref:class I adenylate-forming enzyme family protein n=1 Tax=Sphingobium sp. CR2-8 TaxID=1306534 RepID=UPI002DBCD5A9|nr:AMP-binding protein [Sphingobium sp. CR2-8]MEC3911873.1 AMP-binding protein [Sphingobium sp. CR2-8]